MRTAAISGALLFALHLIACGAPCDVPRQVVLVDTRASQNNGAPCDQPELSTFTHSIVFDYDSSNGGIVWHEGTDKWYGLVTDNSRCTISIWTGAQVAGAVLTFERTLHAAPGTAFSGKATLTASYSPYDKPCVAAYDTAKR